MRRVAPTLSEFAVLHQGRVQTLHAYTLALQSRFATLSSDFVLRLWKDELSCTSDPTKPIRKVGLAGVQVEWGQLDSGEIALRLKFTTSRSRCCSGQSRKQLTLIVSSLQSLRSWVKAISVLFANTGHSPVVRRGEEGSVGNECTICLCEFNDGELLTVLPCQHRFHEDCIGEWFCRSNACPNCKRSCSVDGAIAFETRRFSIRSTGVSS